MHSNIWCNKKKYAGQNLCDLHLTRINKSHAEICRFTVYSIIPSYSMTHTEWKGWEAWEGMMLQNLCIEKLFAMTCVYEYEAYITSIWEDLRC